MGTSHESTYCERIDRAGDVGGQDEGDLRLDSGLYDRLGNRAVMGQEHVAIERTEVGLGDTHLLAHDRRRVAELPPRRRRPPLLTRGHDVRLHPIRQLWTDRVLDVVGGQAPSFGPGCPDPDGESGGRVRDRGGHVDETVR